MLRCERLLLIRHEFGFKIEASHRSLSGKLYPVVADGGEPEVVLLRFGKEETLSFRQLVCHEPFNVLPDQGVHFKSEPLHLLKLVIRRLRTHLSRAN